MMRRKATLAPAALEIVAEGCLRGFDAAAEAVEVAVDGEPRLIELAISR